MTTRTIILLVIASTWAVLHVLALSMKLYWYLWWFDLPMHFIGGVVIAFLVAVARDLRIVANAYKDTLLHTVLFAAVVAIGWEVFELWAGIPMEANYVFDTLVDVLCGLLGAAVGYIVARRLGTL